MFCYVVLGIFWWLWYGMKWEKLIEWNLEVVSINSLKLFLLREKIVVLIKISVIYVWLYKIKKNKKNKGK